MSKFRARLARIAERLTSNQTQLAKARKRYKAARKREERAKARAVKAEKAADRARAEDGFNATGASAFDLEAAKLRRKGNREHDRAIYWRGKIKTAVQKIKGLETRKDKIEADLKKWEEEHGVQVRGNAVTGGTPRQRLRAALQRAMLNYQQGRQPGYYSQGGLERLYHKMLEGMPYGHIFDCSTFADGIYACCDLKDPSGTNYHEGYTGTEGAHGKKVSAANAQTGDLVLYGPFPHHHVEVVLDPARQTTVGHGSPPIDLGTFNLFGDNDFIIRSYL